MFTAKEMELICVFHSGTRSATLEVLRKVAAEIEFPEQKSNAENVVAKLSAMNATEPVALAFDEEV